MHVSTLMVCLPIDLEGKSTRQVEQILESQGVTEESSQLSSASSHGRRIRWLLSSASLGNIEEEADSVRVESSASGATLEVSIHIKYDKFILTFYSNIQIHACNIYNAPLLLNSSIAGGLSTLQVHQQFCNIEICHPKKYLFLVKYLMLILVIILLYSADFMEKGKN